MRSGRHGQEGRVTREPDPTGFDAIVASWRAEGNVPEWPDDLRLDDDRTDVAPG